MGQTLCSTDSHALFRSLHLSTWLGLETLTLGAGNLGIPAFREPLKHSLALPQALPPPPISSPSSSRRPLENRLPEERSALSVLQPLSIHNGAGAVRVYCTTPIAREAVAPSVTLCSTRDHDHHVIFSTVRV